MSHRILLVLIVLIASAIACNAPGDVAQEPTTAGPTSADPTSLQAAPTGSAATQAPTDGPVAAATQGATAPPPPTSAPGGSPTYFGSEIIFNDEQTGLRTSRKFAEGTEEIFATWAYEGMKPGWTVRREWYLNGALWLEREEPWNFDRYGATGRMFDISIYDFELGLPLGQYELRLYVNGQPQFSGDAVLRSFEIVPEKALAIPSDDGTLTAYVEDRSKLVVESASGQRILEIFDEANPNVTEIAGFDWMPQGQYLVYSIMTLGPENLPFPTFVLSLVHVDTGTTYELGSGDERLHHPVVSPDGRYIALIQGTGYADACGGGWQVAIMEMHTAKVERIGLSYLHEFALPPAPVEANAFSMDAPDLLLPGEWVSSTRLKTGIGWMCIMDGQDSPQGVYELDLSEMTAGKVADLP